jgi:hypothetical protein
MPLYMQSKDFWLKIKKIVFSDVQGIPECGLIPLLRNKGELQILKGSDSGV